MGLGMVATAMVTEDYALKVILWQVDADGDWQRKSDCIVPILAVGEVAVSRMGIEHFVTAARTTAGNLYMLAWKITASGDLTWVAEASAGAVYPRTLRVCPVGRDNRVVTTLETSTGNLKLISWQLTDDNQLLRTGDALAGEIYSAECARIDTDLLVTSVSTGTPTSPVHKLIAWRVNNDGLITRADDYATSTNMVASSATRLSTEMAATAVVSQSQELQLDLWKITGNGAIISHAASHPGSYGTEASVCPIDLGKLAVAVIDYYGHLQVWIYDTGAQD
jgi:hypothetical protein